MAYTYENWLRWEGFDKEKQSFLLERMQDFHQMTKHSPPWKNLHLVKHDNFGFLYVIKNHLNDKQYVGKKTIKVKHGKVQWQLYWGSSFPLKTDILLNGFESFSREIREVFDADELFYAERNFILANRCVSSPDWYNRMVPAVNDEVTYEPDYMFMPAAGGRLMQKLGVKP